MIVMPPTHAGVSLYPTLNPISAQIQEELMGRDPRALGKSRRNEALSDSWIEAIISVLAGSLISS